MAADEYRSNIWSLLLELRIQYTKKRGQCQHKAATKKLPSKIMFAPEAV